MPLSCPDVSASGAVPRFSRTVSLLSAFVLVAALGAILWQASTTPKLDHLDNPAQALELMAQRTLEAHDGLAMAPPWQRGLIRWATGGVESERAQLIEWYEELVATGTSPQVRLQLAILHGEFGHQTQAVAAARSWTSDDVPSPFYAQVIDAAYGPQALPRDQEFALQAELAEVLPAGWFYNHLAASLARRAGDTTLGETVRQDLRQRGVQAQRRARWLNGVELFCWVAGSGLLMRMVWRGRLQDRLHEPGVPPPWPGGVGKAVLLRGGALGALITLAFASFAPPEHVSLRALAIPAANLPLLALASVYLFQPVGLTFWQGFGLQLEWRRLGRLAGVVLAVIAAGLWGEWGLSRAAEWLGLANHWTEWFDAELVWGSGSILTVSLLEYVVFAPIFEELAFRGMLYAMLRRRLAPLPAALLSAGVFALAHGYGLVGFLSVLWSGLLWAWVYERTGSLIPGMIAHATNNLLVCLGVMTLLR